MRTGQKEITDYFFALLQQTLNDLNLNEKPKCIFNWDETGFACDRSKKGVFCRRGSQP